MGKRKLKSAEVAAIEDLLRRIRIAGSKGDYVELASLHNQLGNQYRLLGDYGNAIEHHKEEIEISTSYNKNDKMGLGIAYRNMGEVYTEMKEEDKAISFITKYLKIAKEVRNAVEEQRACITLGNAYLSKAGKESNEEDEGRSKSGNQSAIALAEGWFRNAYKLLTEDKLKDELNSEKELMLMKCNNCQNLGLTLEVRGKLHDACTWILKAIDIGCKYQFHDNLAPCYSIVCGIYLNMGRAKDALKAARDAAKTAKSLGNLALEVEAALLEAKALFLADEVDDGKKLLKKWRQRIRKKDTLHSYFDELDPLLTAAVRICRTQDNLFAAAKEDTDKRMKLYETLGDNYTTLTNFAVAIASYKKSCEYAEKAGIQGKKLSRLYFSIAESYRDLEDYSNAHEYYLKELELNRGNLAEEFKTQTIISVVLEKMNESETEVVRAHEHAITLAQMASNLSKEVTARSNFAAYLKGIERGRESEEQLEIVKKITEENNICDNDDSQDLLDEEEEFIDLDDLSEEEDSDDETDNRRGSRKRANTRVNEAGETQLHIAAKKGDLKAVRRLIRQGHIVKAKDNAGWTPLHEACNFGHVSVVEELLKNGADVNDPGGALAEKLTPLHDAASNGHCEVMKVLIQYGAKILARNIEGRYPIDLLITWRESGNGSDLSENELVTYREVRELLKEQMKKAGKPYRKEDEKIARKRALRSGSPKRSLLVRKAQDYDCPIPVIIATDDFDPDQEGDGQKLYQNAIKLVGRKDTEKKSSKPRTRAMSPGPRGALIPAELDVHDDWLLPDDAIAGTSTSTSANRSSKPKRKRDPMDDVVFEGYRSNRRSSGGHKNKNRRKSQVSVQEDDGFELMDLDLDTDSRERHVSGESSSSISQAWSPAFNDVTIMDNDFGSPIASSAHDDFLPSQRPSASTVEFGKTDCVQVDSDSDSDRGSPELASIFRDRNGNRSPAKKSSRRNALESSDEDDNSFSGSGSNKTSKLKFSRIASAIKQSGLNNSNQLGRNRRTEKNLIQTRMSFKVLPKPSSRLSNEYSREDRNRSSSPEEIRVSPTPSVSSNISNTRRNTSKEVWRLKVWIQGKPMLVPVEEEKLNETVDWLASECAKRYLEAHGVKPILKLQTKDGAILAGSDPIRLVLDADNKELEGVVTSFDLPPLIDRYCSACLAEEIEEDMEVKSNLNLCQSSNVLNVTDVNLRCKAGKALMTALQRQSSLNTLILSGCSLFDDGVLELCKALPTLSGLTHLDLSSNGITISGFMKFAEVFVETSTKTDACSAGSRVPLGISALILSHNPLGNFVGSSLAALLNNLTVLKRLDIADCDFTEKLFIHSRNDLTKALSNSRLEELDISYNNLKEVGLELCLQHLPAQKIRSLNCSSCATNMGDGPNSAVAKAVCLFLSRNDDCCNLTTLKLHDCGLNDQSMELLLDTFHRLVRLENLELTCNEDLTALSITNIVRRSVDRDIPLTRLEMGGIPRIWESPSATPEMILHALELKMGSNKKLLFLKLPTEEIVHQRSQEQSQVELSKLESLIVTLMEEYTGNASFNYKKFGSCIVFELND